MTVQWAFSEDSFADTNEIISFALVFLNINAIFGWSLLLYRETFIDHIFHENKIIEEKKNCQLFVAVATTMATIITIAKNAIVTPVTTTRRVFFFEPKAPTSGLKKSPNDIQTIVEYKEKDSRTFLALWFHWQTIYPYLYRVLFPMKIKKDNWREHRQKIRLHIHQYKKRDFELLVLEQPWCTINFECWFKFKWCETSA